MRHDRKRDTKRIWRHRAETAVAVIGITALINLIGWAMEQREIDKNGYQVARTLAGAGPRAKDAYAKALADHRITKSELDRIRQAAYVDIDNDPNLNVGDLGR